MKRFNLYLAVIAVLIDALAISSGLILAYQLRAGGGELYAWPFVTYLKLVGVLLPIWLILLASQGLYPVRTLRRGWNVIPRLLVGLLAGWAVMIVFLFFWRSTAADNFPRLVIIYGLVFTTGFTLLGKLIINLIIDLAYRFGRGRIRTVVVGSDKHQNFVSTLKIDRRSGRQIVAIVKDSELIDGQDLTDQPFDELIVATKLADEKLLGLLNWAERRGVSFVSVPTLASVRSSNVELGSLAGTPVMYWHRSPLEGWGRIYKRVLDLILVIPALIILSPIYLILAVVVKLTSPGPIIYHHERVGQDGSTIIIHKFRSMYVDADKRFKEFGGWSAEEKSDPRVTPLGRLIRATNIDELPQLWDVLMGKMSLVGPRPEQPRYVTKFAREVPDYILRHQVKSGLTGWAQINGARGNTPIADRVKYDLYYIEHWSVWFDLRIILATFVVIFRQMMH